MNRHGLFVNVSANNFLNHWPTAVLSSPRPGPLMVCRTRICGADRSAKRENEVRPFATISDLFQALLSSFVSRRFGASLSSTTPTPTPYRPAPLPPIISLYVCLFLFYVSFCPCLPSRLSVRLVVSLCLYVCLCLPVSVPPSPPRLSLCVSLCLSLFFSLCLFLLCFCLGFSRSLSVYLNVCLSVSLSVGLFAQRLTTLCS